MSASVDSSGADTPSRSHSHVRVAPLERMFPSSARVTPAGPSQAIVRQSPSTLVASEIAMIDEPVPYDAFTDPGRHPALANNAACESPRTPATGVPIAAGPSATVVGTRGIDETTSGRHSTGTSNPSHSSGSQATVAMSSSDVRLALPASVRWRPVRRHSSHESIVPTLTRPVRARLRSGSYASSSQEILAAENMGSSSRPVRVSTTSARCARRSQIATARWSCQDNAGPSGLPVTASQATTVSRCVEREMPSTCPVVACVAATTELQIASASCSTQPG